MTDYEKAAARFGGTSARPAENKYEAAARKFGGAATGAASRQPQVSPDPTLGMSTSQRVLAGIGKAFVDTGRGVGQMMGLVSDEDIAEARRLDAPLMNTTAGKVGNFAGNVGVAAPAMFVPGANTVAGAALVGGLQGLVQPTVGDESRLKNAAIGGAAGAGGVVAARAVMGGVQGARALGEPFTKAGRDRVAGRVLERFATDPNSIMRASGARSATGAQPTLAEATRDEGLAKLQDLMLNASDPQITGRVAARMADNNAARVQSIQSLAGTGAQREAAEQARDAAAKHLYQQATRATYPVDGELANLLQRPAVKQAMARAETLAANQGRPFSFVTDPSTPFSALGVGAQRSHQVTGQGLQDLKMAMDEMLADPASGFTGAAGNTVKSLRGKLVDWMEQANPDFRNARLAYAEASKPLNGMDVGEYLATKATSNTADLAGNPRMMANALLGTVRDEQKLVRAATGRKDLKSLDKVFSRSQLELLKAVTAETDLAAAVRAAGQGSGPATAQRLASQNILHQMIGPTGLPQSWAESVLANTVIGKPANLLYGGIAEPKIQQTLAEAVLSPEAARAVLEAARRGQITLPQSAMSQLLLQSIRATPSTLAVTGERGK